MKFNFAIETSQGVEPQINLVVKLSHELKKYFADRHYGEDVQEIIIRIIIVAPEFEWFSKIRKPKFVSFRSHSRDGIEIIEDRLFSYSLKIDYRCFKTQSDEMNKEMLKEAVVSSVINLEHLPKKVKDFDRDRFISDLKYFFTSR